MTTKKAKKAPQPPGKRRAPKKKPPLTDAEILFCHRMLKGSADLKATQTERIEAAGEAAGYTKVEALRLYHTIPIQKYIEGYRADLRAEMIREEVRTLKRKGYTREDVLAHLDRLATIPPEKTKGSITGQVSAAEAMGKILGLVVAPKNADDLFKGRTEQELEHFAAHGTFSPGVVM
jgi:hypothetical protein